MTAGRQVFGDFCCLSICHVQTDSAEHCHTHWYCHVDCCYSTWFLSFQRLHNHYAIQPLSEVRVWILICLLKSLMFVQGVGKARQRCRKVGSLWSYLQTCQNSLMKRVGVKTLGTLEFKYIEALISKCVVKTTSLYNLCSRYYLSANKLNMALQKVVKEVCCSPTRISMKECWA